MSNLCSCDNGLSASIDGRCCLCRDQQAKTPAGEALVAALVDKKKRGKEQAQKFFKAGATEELDFDYPAAMASYRRAVALGTGNARYLHAAGTMARSLGEYEEAILYFERKLIILLKHLEASHPEVKKTRTDIKTTRLTKGLEMRHALYG